MYSRLLALTLILAPSLVAAAPPSEEQLLPQHTFGFVRFETGELWRKLAEQGLRQWMEDADLVATVKERLGVGPEAVERVLVFFVSDEQGKPPDSAVFVVLNQPARAEKLKKSMLVPAKGFQSVGQPAPPEPALTEVKVGKHGFWTYDEKSPWSAGLCIFDERHFLAGSVRVVRAVLDGIAEPRKAEIWQGPMQRARGVPFAAAFNLDVVPARERDLAPAPFTALAKAKTALFTIKLGEGMEIHAEAAFGTAAEAQAAATAIGEVLGLAKEGMPTLKHHVAQAVVEEPDVSKELYDLLPKFEEMIGELKPQTTGTTVALDARLRVPAASLAFLPVQAVNLLGSEATAVFRAVDDSLGAPREAPRLPRPSSAAALKKLAEGLEKYRAEHGRYPPPAILSPTGKPLLSWRVALLPYLGEEALYREFRLDEPWNSEHNRALLDRIPAAFKGAFPYGGRTPFRIVTGQAAGFTERAQQGPALADFTAGPVQSVLVTEAFREVPWTRPESLKLIPEFPLPRMADDDAYGFARVGGGQLLEGFYVLMADGKVRFFEKKTDLKTRRALLTRVRDERLPEDKLGEVVK